jgi:hypothetical protein
MLCLKRANERHWTLVKQKKEELKPIEWNVEFILGDTDKS